MEELKLKRELAAGRLEISRSTSIASSRDKKPAIIATRKQQASQIPAPSVSFRGLSTTALERVSKLNQIYMQETIGPSKPPNKNNDDDDDSNITPNLADDDLLVSDEESPPAQDPEVESENDEEEGEELYLQINRQHISLLQQRKLEIQQRKAALANKKIGEPISLLQPASYPVERVPWPESPSRSIEPTSTVISTPQFEEPPMSRLEQLKLKKRLLEAAPQEEPPSIKRQPWPESQSEEEPLSRLEQLKLKKRQLEVDPSAALPKKNARQISVHTNARPVSPPGFFDKTNPAALGAPQPPPSSTTTMTTNTATAPPSSTTTMTTNTATAIPKPENTDGIRVVLLNQNSKRSLDMVVSKSDKLNLYDTLYNSQVVKQANIRKWGNSVVDKVNNQQHEIVVGVSTLPKGEEHFSFSVEELKLTTTQELVDLYSPEYDPQNPNCKIQLLLQCQPSSTSNYKPSHTYVMDDKTSSSNSNTTTDKDTSKRQYAGAAVIGGIAGAVLAGPVVGLAVAAGAAAATIAGSKGGASGEAVVQNTQPVPPSPKSNTSSPEAFRREQHSKVDAVMHKFRERRKSLDLVSRRNSRESNQSSDSNDRHRHRLSREEEKDYNPSSKPYAEAASIVLPIHDTETTFSDLKKKQIIEQQQHQEGFDVALDEAETGTRIIPPTPLTTTKEAQCQTIVVPTKKSRSSRSPPPEICPALQSINVCYWITLILILVAALVAALLWDPFSYGVE
jgi:hypothetical protein